MSPATVVTAETLGAEAPDVIACGDPDDHLRLAALVAHLPGADPILAAQCASPLTPWAARLDALAGLLDGLGTRFCLGDLDALHPGEITVETRWDDLLMRRQRLETFQRVVELARHREQWVLVRSVRNAEVSKALVDAGIALGDAAVAADVPPVVSSEMRAGARWLMRKGLRPIDLMRLLDTSEDPDAEIAAAVFDHLPGDARTAAMRLSVQRAPAACNGHVGRFQVASGVAADGASAHAIGPAALETLRDAGVLQPHGAATVRMPRRMRAYFARWARVDPNVAPAELHGWLSRFDAQTHEEHVEAHHHAVLSGDVDRAFETATYYVTDLRQLAYELSRVEQRFDDAARVYRRLLEVYDPQDAYAWEYLAYNLARQHAAGMPEAVATEIEAAYERAHVLEPDNPLFHGRLLGFRAQRHRDVLAEFHRLAAHYDASYELEGLGYFARPVVTGLLRGAQREALAAIKERWIGRLRAVEPVRVLLEPP